MKISLRAKTVLGIICMSLIISATAVALSYRTYANTMDEHYQKMTLDLAETAIAMLDSEKIQQYAETLEKDEYYNDQLEILRKLVEANDEALYIYINVPPNGGSFVEGDPIYDIMDTDPEVAFPEEEVAYLDIAAGDNIVYISETEEYGWLCTAVVWMYDETGDTYAFMNVDISMNDVMADRMDFLRVVLFAILLAMVAACVILVLLVNRFVVNPINQVARAALQYVSDRRTSEGRSASTGVRRISTGEDGEEHSAISKLNIRTGDEIQALSEAIKTMELEINEYIQDLTTVTAEKERIGAELNVATQIQADMLPRIFPAFPEREEFDVYATMNPAKEVGGDFYDFFLVDDDHLAVVIADVSGKGVPAALFMVIAKTLIKNHAQNQEAPGTVFTQTNEQLCEGNDAGLFVTGWMGVLEISTGKFVYVNAGHNPPLLKRAGGTFEWLKSRPGFVLAGMEGVRYRENTLQLEPGDRLYLYTDGVTEATNSHEELFGDERLQNALNEYMDLPVEQFLPKIKECIDAFVATRISLTTSRCSLWTIRAKERRNMIERIFPATEDQLEPVQSFIDGSWSSTTARPRLRSSCGGG